MKRYQPEYYRRSKHHKLARIIAIFILSIILLSAFFVVSLVILDAKSDESNNTEIQIIDDVEDTQDIDNDDHSNLSAGVSLKLYEINRITIVEAKTMEAKTTDVNNVSTSVVTSSSIESENIEPEVTSSSITKKKESKKKKKAIKWKTGYTNTSANIRKKPSTDSKILGTVEFNTKIKYAKYNKKWYYVKYNDKTAYIAKSLVSKEKLNYRSVYLSSKGFKSYMPYTAITSKSSPQYKLQHSYAYTGTYGIRQVDGRYCVAVGSAATSEIGVYIDLVLKNGTVIPCVLADQKANKDTLSDNLTTAGNGCVSEFLVDYNALNRNAKRAGDISACTSEWNSPVVEMRIYKKNVMK